MVVGGGGRGTLAKTGCFEWGLELRAAPGEGRQDGVGVHSTSGMAPQPPVWRIVSQAPARPPCTLPAWLAGCLLTCTGRPASSACWPAPAACLPTDRPACAGPALAPRVQIAWRALQEDQRERGLALVKAAFEELDTDGDGVLSIQEIMSSLRNKLPPGEVGCPRDVYVGRAALRQGSWFVDAQQAAVRGGELFDVEGHVCGARCMRQAGPGGMSGRQSRPGLACS